MTRNTLAWCFGVLSIVGTIAAFTIYAQRHTNESLEARLARIVPIAKHIEVSCAEVAATHPLVLLALGQSNAGNHGAPTRSPAEPITLVADGKCVKATDPLPGATGVGGSIWQRLPALMAAHGNARPIVLSVLAVDNTSIEEWTSPDSPLRDRLVSHVASMRRQGLQPDLVLWQQGEADSRIGTGLDDYSRGLGRLATTLRKTGLNAPIIIARSTICRSAANPSIRKAIDLSVSGDFIFRLGPDIDTLSSNRFRDGCHLTPEGLESAAKMWAIVINSGVATIGPAR